ncbi:MAG: efflux RND transporter permease subunit [Bacteroidia bacterium]
MTLTELAIKRPSLIVVLFSVLGLMGWLSYNALSYELLPSFSAPILSVSTVYPGASPAEIENTVSKVVEEATASLEGIKRISATSFESLSLIIIELNTGVDVNLAQQDCQRKLNQIAPLLPKNAKPPVIGKISSSDFPVMRMSASSSLEPTTFYQMMKDEIKPQIASIKGVAEVTLVGGEEKTIKVNINRNAMESRRVSILQVMNAVGNANLDFPTGKVKTDESQIRVRLAGKFTSLDDLRNLQVAQFPDGSKVKLGEIAEIVEGTKDASTINRIDGNPSIGINIKKQTDANGVEVSKGVLEKLVLLEQRYAKDNVKLTVAADASEFTIEAADAVKHDLLLAVMLVALVILVFLHSLKDSFIVMVAIPASFIVTFIAFYLFGFTLNLMTLLGLTLVVGILVDDSIVVLENIHRHLHLGKEPRTAALDGRNEIGFTALSITLVDVVVFLPLALSNAGVISDILRQFSWTIVISTLLSLFVSFTVTPLLASRISKLQELSKKTAWGRINLWIEEQITNLAEWYGRRLVWGLNNKAVVLLGSLGLLIFSFALAGMGLIGSEFVSKGDRGEAIVYIELDKTVTLEQTNRASFKAEQILQGVPEIARVIASVGGSSSSMDFTGGSQYKSEITVKMVPLDKRKESTNEIIDRAKKEIALALPTAKVTAATVGIMGGADQAPIQMIMSNENQDTLMAVSDRIKDMVKAIPGTSDVELSVQAGMPEVKIELDEEKLAAFGLNVAIVGGTLQTSFAGNTDSKYRKGTTEYDISLALDNFNRKNVEDVKNISFFNQQGQKIALSQFAKVTASSGPSALQRTDRRSSITLKSQLLGRDAGSVSAELVKNLGKMKLSGVEYFFIGDVEEQKRSFGAIGQAFLISIILVYLIMVALYDSYIYPFVVLFAIPVALIGSLFIMALTMSNFSIFTLLGMMVMNGLVCKNSILIVDFANKLKEEGYSSFDALVESGKERLRPILMTTLAMVLGMLPVALAKGAGADWKNGLAWALIGGLSSSMLLTLFVVPAVYLIVDNVKARWAGKQVKTM